MGSSRLLFISQTLSNWLMNKCTHTRIYICTFFFNIFFHIFIFYVKYILYIFWLLELLLFLLLLLLFVVGQRGRFFWDGVRGWRGSWGRGRVGWMEAGNWLSKTPAGSGAEQGRGRKRSACPFHNEKEPCPYLIYLFCKEQIIFCLLCAALNNFFCV